MPFRVRQAWLSALLIIPFCAPAPRLVGAEEQTSTPPLPAVLLPSPALDQLLERAVAAGLPDTRGATWFIGDLQLADDEPPQPGWKQQRSRVHARLADGRWDGSTV